MESREYDACKWAAAEAVEQLRISKNRVKILADRCSGKGALPAHLAAGHLIKALAEAEKALERFMESDRALEKD